MSYASSVIVDPKWQFLEDVLLSSTRRDSLATRKGRRVYAREATDGQRATFAAELFSVLRNISSQYVSTVTEEQHISNINVLTIGLTERCRDSLHENRLAFGVAQKALNSYLKYLWCVDKIATPPHCPFDAIIIGKLQLPPDCERQWTHGEEADYRIWVQAAKLKANPRPLSEWELTVWSSPR